MERSESTREAQVVDAAKVLLAIHHDDDTNPHASIEALLVAAIGAVAKLDERVKALEEKIAAQRT